MQEVVIIDGVRTPFGLLGGALKSFSSAGLGEIVTKELLKRTRLDPKLVQEVIFGCVIQTSDAPNLARVVSLRAGIPVGTTGFTVQRNCASGLQSIVSAFQNIQCDNADVQIAGGAESMSSAPYISREMRFGQRLRHAQFIDSLWEGLTDPVCNLIMGETAENLVSEFKISRTDQDRFALESHQKAFRAAREGKLKEEIVPVSVPKKLYGKELPPEIVSQDEGPNAALNEQLLSQYPAIFHEGGSVTSGNSCPISDGAAAVLVMSAKRAKELGLAPLGTIRSYAFSGVEPQRMGIGPALAIPKALDRAGLKLSDMGLVEINEAFAGQYLAVEKALGLDRKIVNVNGGAIALGHPVGTSGTRLPLTLLKEMRRRGVRYGIASMCVGGGQGGAIVLEKAA